jgi:signal transduction histidine kinase/DNA-binding NarL/FixJ family response regulator
MAKILLFDDNPASRDQLMALIQRCGHQVLDAKDAESGLRRIGAVELDLIFVDISEPEMCKADFIRQLRRSAGDRPIVFLSSDRSGPKNGNRANRLFKVIPKPTKSGELHEAIHKAIGSPALQIPTLPKPDLKFTATSAGAKGNAQKRKGANGLARQELCSLSDLAGKTPSELQAMIWRLAGLARFGLEIHGAPQAEELLEVASQILLQIFSAEFSGLIVFEPGMNVPSQRITQGLTPTEQARLDFSSPAFTRTLAHGRTCRADKPGGEDLASDRYAGLPGYHPQVQDWVGAPIASADRHFGWAYVARLGFKARFNEADELLFKVIGTKLGIAYQNLLQADELRLAQASAEKASAALALANDELQAAGAELRESNDQLEKRVLERTSQLRALAGELIQSEERERRRIAKILHDELQQQLAGARMQVDAALRQRDSEHQKTSLRKVGEILKETMELSRNLSHDLSLVVLHEEGLVAALQWLAGWMGERHELQVNVTCAPVAATLDENTRIALFQAIRELLFNVTKHAGTKEAKVRLSTPGNRRVEVVVSDQGKGIDLGKESDLQPTKAGLGLFSIRERLRALGGSMELQSVPGKGTKVRLLAPLAEPPL